MSPEAMAGYRTAKVMPAKMVKIGMPIEGQAKGLVELEQVVPLEEDGDGVGDDADEDMDDGKHCCCEVGLVIVGVYDVLLRMVLLAEVL